MWGLSIWHWVVVIGVMAVLFGRNTISNLMADLGKSVREVRKFPSLIDEDKA